MASTYVNDLRLNEMATGDGSGTWGTTTNTNLELIAEAFSYGTEVITTNADTHTTTIADGATDPGRSLYLKYTGTLDSACTITIGPNTVSKVWIIENGTSGSQDIILSQGSGANITIPAGDTKVVYSDGAGAGAAFFDAFASLNVVDLKVQDDLTVTDDMTVGGTLGVTGVLTANAGVVVDNFTLDGTTLALSSGDMTLDAAGVITLDAEDAGEVRFLDGGTQYAQIKKDGNNALFQSIVADGDFVIQGIDGASFISALTFDMSDAGTATFNHDIKTAGDGNVLTFSSPAGGGGGTNTINFKHDSNTLAAAQIVATYTSDYRATLDFKINKVQSDSTPTSALLINQGGNATFSGTIAATELNVSQSDNSTRSYKLLQGYGYTVGGNYYGQYAIGTTYDAGSNTGTLEFFTGSGLSAPTKRMDINSSGVISMTSVGSTSLSLDNTRNVSGDTGIFQYLGSNCSNASSVFFSGLITGVGNKIYIFGNGNIVNTNNSYGAISDLKLKENITDASPKLAELNKVRVVNYNFINDETKQLGVIAQELEAIFPAMIDETPDRESYDAVVLDADGSPVVDEDGNNVTEQKERLTGESTKSVKYSVFVPMLVKAMQEQTALIESLTARIEALEE
jgi:hypothetical protein